MGEVPASFDSIKKYLLKATELAKKEPVISYHCKLYFLEVAQQSRQEWMNDKTAKEFCLSIMDQIEMEREALKDNPAMASKEASRSYFESFWVKIFTLVKKREEAGQTDQQTLFIMKNLNTFGDVLKSLGDLSAEMKESIKFIKLKTLDYTKAFKEGIQPTPGPLSTSALAADDSEDGLGQNQLGSVADKLSRIQTDEPPTSNQSSADLATQLPKTPDVPRVASKKKPFLTAADFEEPLPQDYLNFVEPAGANPQDVANAQRFAKFAISALLFDDIPSAIKNLEDALKVLKPYKK